ncbi:uncharacterized protein [Dysidea avara]|uniref:uncharacterized protein n=1 Tax=Dysidea avara TaxID=196820 RepID=UPI00332D394E
MKQDWYVLSRKQKEEVYKVWSNAQKKALTVLPSGLSLNDVWSLFSTHWLTDKVITTFLQIALQKCSNDTRGTFVASTFLCNSLNRHSEVTRRWYQKYALHEMLGIKTYNCNAGNFNHIGEWMTWMLFNTH